MAAALTSPFTPSEQTAIVVASVAAVLLAVWNISRALRPRGGPVRYAPFGLAILLLSFAFMGFVVVYAVPFLLRFPELVVAVGAVGLLALSIAYAHDRKFETGAGAEPAPPAVRAPIWESYLPRPLTSFLRHYTSALPVLIESPYGTEQSLSRVLKLDGRGEIRVWVGKDGGLLAVGGQWFRSNVLQVFRGHFEEREGRTVLCGEIRVDRGISLALLLFGLAPLILLPFRIGILVWELGVLGLLSFFYLIGKGDPSKIIGSLQKALHEEPVN